MSAVKMTVDIENRISKINKEIYGHFAEHLGRCVYGGIYVGEDSPIPNIRGYRKDVIEALKAIKVPVIRWPGGCFADTYHWKDGIGPKGDRKKIVNIHWGGVTEDNSFGTHEFLDFCELIGCEAYVALNLGSGTVQEAAEWAEYMTSDSESPMTELRKKNGRERPWKVKYFGIGNESWGCGGEMNVDFYSNLYKQYHCFARGAEQQIACGPNGNDLYWTEGMMKNVGPWAMQGLSLHYYTIPNGGWNSSKGDSVDFSEEEYYKTLQHTWYMERILKDQEGLMQRYDGENKIGLIVDEWGIWTDSIKGTNPGFLYQQNTMRDAIIASINLNLFNEHSQRVKMANIAQMINVLQAILLTEGDRMVKTPTYHVFDMYKEHMDAELVYSHCESSELDSSDGRFPAISQSASVDADGRLHITISNASLNDDFEISCAIPRAEYKNVSARILTGEYNAFNDFDKPDNLTPKACEGVELSGERLTIKLPKCSVVSVELK